MQKAKEIYSKEKTAEYYLQNRISKRKVKNWYKNLLQEENGKVKDYQRKRYQSLIQYKKEALQNKYVFFVQYNNVQIDTKC